MAGNQYLKRQAEALGARAYCLEVAENTERILQRAPHEEARRNPGLVRFTQYGKVSASTYADIYSLFQRFPKARLLVVGRGAYRQAESVGPGVKYPRGHHAQKLDGQYITYDSWNPSDTIPRNTVLCIDLPGNG